MLLRFSVANHLSIKNAQALSLTASSLKDAEEGLIDCATAPGGRALPAVVIYGANASGKTNVVAALRFLRSAVLFSHSRGEPGGGVQRSPFALDPACAEAPTTLTADFVVEGVRYHYGFEASDEAFEREWLYAFPSGRRQVLFERESARFTFGRGLRGRNRTISDLTRPNSLFLSAAAQNDHEQLSKVVEFFQSINSDTAISVPGGAVSMIFSDDDVDARVVDFLSNIGTGVIDYQRREREIRHEIQMIQQELVSLIQRHLKDFDPEKRNKRFTVELAHRGSDGSKVFFDLDRESAGTRRLLILLTKVFRSFDRGVPLVVDELDASLHTQACEAVLALFSSRANNPKGAQLIATTHDTNLLRSPLLRRDQIWFTEKDAEGATHLYPLTDIRTRQGDNIERGYLQGRYGAIPFSGRISELVTAA
jgi:AAA15 family ATPase/GTPase